MTDTPTTGPRDTDTTDHAAAIRELCAPQDDVLEDQVWVPQGVPIDLADDIIYHADALADRLAAAEARAARLRRLAHAGDRRRAYHGDECRQGTRRPRRAGGDDMTRRMIDPTAAEFGPRVRAQRTAQGLTLRQVAARSGVAYSHLSAVERGRKDVTLSHAIRIARALDLPLWALLGEEMQP